MKKLFIFLLAILTVVGCSKTEEKKEEKPAFVQIENPEWILALQDEKEEFYIREDVIPPTKENNFHAKVWVKQLADKAKPVNFDLFLHEIDCVNKKFSTISIAIYRNGKLQKDETIAKPHYYYAIPETWGETFTLAACSGKSVRRFLKRYAGQE